MRNFYHSKLGNIKVIVEIEHCEDYISSGKHIALVKCFMVPSETGWNSFQYVDKRWTSGKMKPEYYLLWGNTEDLNERGITHISTPSGRAVSERTALKHLHAAHKAANSVSFKHV